LSRWFGAGGTIGHPFQRVTSSIAFIPQIDGLRALAVLLVFAHHSFALYLEQTHRLGTQSLPRDWGLIYNRSALVPWALHLPFGISIFFVISGFVLALPFARSGRDGLRLPSTGLYLLRRLIRLEPPYVIGMIFFFLMICQPWGPHWHFWLMFHIFGPHLLATLVYLHALIFRGPSWINGVAWTLEIEVQFYLLMPLLARLFLLRAKSTRRGIFLGLVLASALFDQFALPHFSDPRLGWSLAGHLEFFLAGVLLADLYLDLPRRLELGPRIYDMLAVASAAALVYVLHWRPSLGWVNAFVLMVFFLSVFRGALTSRLFSLKALTIPGTMCYTIYLYHIFILEHSLPFTLRLIPPVHALWLDELLQMIVLLPIVLAISGILYLLIERPFIVLSHRATRRWRQRNHAPVVGA
jgi:peptidoglycan/LPS O-acetylase OafA/YrhL